jgi:hypothetical protein
VAPAAADTVGELVIDADAPDPEVLVDIDGRYWLFSTQVSFTNVPVRSSTDLRSWSGPTEALPQLGSWARWGFTWSPGVERFGSSYVLFYTARSLQYGVQCIGRAVASSPGGPYVDPSSQPLVCQPELGGSIDASVHRDAAGAPWLLWKSDGNGIGVPSRVWSAPLAVDGSGLAGPATMLLASTSADEGIIENPAMEVDGNRTVLVLSVGSWWTARYHEEVAVCAGPRGPCQRQAGQWLGAASGIVGPGGGSLFPGAGGGWMLAVHGWRQGVGYESGAYRGVWIGPVDLSRPPMWSVAPVPPPPQPLPPSTGDGPGAASADTGQIDVFARGQDDALWTRHLDGSGWREWASLGGIVTSAPAAASRGAGLVDVFARGQDNALWTRQFDGSSWSEWSNLGGILTSGPGVASAAPGTLDVFVAGADRRLYTRHLDGAGWGPWQSLGGIITASPAAASADTGTLSVFARGQDNALWTQAFDGSTWSGWSTLGGIITAAPGATSIDVGTIDVFARGQDNRLWTRQFDGSWSAWSTLGGVLTSPVAPVTAASGTVDFFTRGSDVALWATHHDGTDFTGWYTLGGIIR